MTASTASKTVLNPEYQQFYPILQFIGKTFKKPEVYLFKEIFKGSYLRWEYFYFEKYYKKRSSDRSFPELYLDLDNKHRLMVAEYVVEETATTLSAQKVADLMTLWYRCWYNFDSGMWSWVFGEEALDYKVRMSKGCGVNTVKMCSLFTKVKRAFQYQMYRYCMEGYRDNIHGFEKLQQAREREERFLEQMNAFTDNN
ncbi:hypothetical protein [Algivirga pacifica]|uniref:Uncharacterized protein n=1 Tax=Algivirga pacifica TaxID=1162670 RepID=A0ABP9DCD8_9BACT